MVGQGRGGIRSRSAEKMITDNSLKSGTTPAVVTSFPRDWLSGKRYRIRGIATDLSLLIIGCVVSLLGKVSPEIILLALFVYGGSAGMLLFPKLGGLYERRIFTRVFVVCFIMAGVSAGYRNVLGDLQGDALWFYEMSTVEGGSLALQSLAVLHEGALAILVWRGVYNAIATLGFPREPYIGILVNITVVALTGVVALKMARQVYGEDPYRFQRLTLLFAACGLLWLFAGIHLRDAIVLLAVTALSFVWLHFLARPGLGLRLLQVVGASLGGALVLGLLRSEFLFVPIGMATAAVAALMLGRKSERKQLVAYVLVMLGLAATWVLIAVFGEAIMMALLMGQQGYLEHAAGHHGSDSLGMALILNQPGPIRLVFGTIYLFVFPIPFWSGFQLESAYRLFVSLNVLFFYLLIPALVLAGARLWKDRAQRTPALLFVFFLSFGFSLAIGSTSLETRHLGAFLAPLFVLALLPDFRVRAVAGNYKKLVVFMLGGVMIVHALWLVLKVA